MTDDLLVQYEPKAGRDVRVVDPRVRIDAIAVEHVGHAYVVSGIEEDESIFSTRTETEIPLCGARGEVE